MNIGKELKTMEIPYKTILLPNKYDSTLNPFILLKKVLIIENAHSLSKKDLQKGAVKSEFYECYVTWTECFTDSLAHEFPLFSTSQCILYDEFNNIIETSYSAIKDHVGGFKSKDDLENISAPFDSINLVAFENYLSFDKSNKDYVVYDAVRLNPNLVCYYCRNKTEFSPRHRRYNTVLPPRKNILKFYKTDREKVYNIKCSGSIDIT